MLKCSKCRQLQSLPVADLPHLTELDCSGTGITELHLPAAGQPQPAPLLRLLCGDTSIQQLDLGGVPLLQFMDISNCSQLKQLKCDAPHLKEFNGSYCVQLRALDLSAPKLELLTFKQNAAMRRPLNFSKCPLLNVLRLGTPGSDQCPDLAPLSQLETLILNGMGCLELCIPPSVAATLVQLLLVVKCQNMVCIRGLRNCTALRELRIQECEKLDSVVAPMCLTKGALATGSTFVKFE